MQSSINGNRESLASGEYALDIREDETKSASIPRKKKMAALDDDYHSTLLE
ncbi:hypothetical protein [Shewanella sp. VB17]|uniref:hypothetical protein n=1 Tax=Shewanella sp. VB17 TaxID=2739432 RepID=UPI0035C9172D